MNGIQEVVSSNLIVSTKLIRENLYNPVILMTTAVKRFSFFML